MNPAPRPADRRERAVPMPIHQSLARQLQLRLVARAKKYDRRIH